MIAKVKVLCSKNANKANRFVDIKVVDVFLISYMPEEECMIWLEVLGLNLSFSTNLLGHQARHLAFLSFSLHKKK